MKVSVIVGENGTGKTSILKCISSVFFYPMIYKEELDHGFSVQYKINNKAMVFDQAQPFTENQCIYPSKVIVSTYSLFEQFEKYPKISKAYPVEYVHISPVSQMGRSSISEVGMSILDAFYGKKTNRTNAVLELLSLIGYIDPPAVEVRIDSSAYTPRKYTKSKLIPYDANTANRLRTYHLNKGQLFNKRARTILLYPEQITANWLKDLHQATNAGLPIIKELWFRKGTEWIPASQLSSGELTMFARLFPLINKIEHNAIVLIDEPETHLHPKWIQQYVHILSRVFGRFKSHFILATHSPMIASDVPKECIVGLYLTSDGNVREYKVDQSTLGGNPSEILQEVFRLDDYHGTFSSRTMEEIVRYATKGDIDQALAMYRDIGDSLEKMKIFKALKPHLSGGRGNVES